MKAEPRTACQKLFVKTPSPVGDSAASQVRLLCYPCYAVGPGLLSLATRNAGEAGLRERHRIAHVGSGRRFGFPDEGFGILPHTVLKQLPICSAHAALD